MLPHLAGRAHLWCQQWIWEERKSAAQPHISDYAASCRLAANLAEVGREQVHDQQHCSYLAEAVAFRVQHSHVHIYPPWSRRWHPRLFYTAAAQVLQRGGQALHQQAHAAGD